MTVYMFICGFLAFCLQGMVSSMSCGSKKSLSVIEGDNIVLQLDLNDVPLTSVTWNYQQHIIATTSPGEAVKMGAFGSDYTGRLGANVTDGSLIIKQLSRKDFRAYRAELYKNGMYVCTQIYDVRILGNTGESPGLMDPSEGCGSTIQFYHKLGDTVTLRLPDRPQITFVTWDVNNIDHIAITRPGQIEVRNSSYSGRLSVTSDGSLQLSRIKTNDERVYRAELFINFWQHYCTQLLEVQVSAVFPLRPCAPAKRLSVIKGDNIVLQLGLKDVPLTSVTWNYQQHIIATTSPGQALKIGAFGSDYTGRLGANSRDGSLIITGLSPKDFRAYRAELYKDGTYVCTQIYDVRILGNNGNSPNISEPLERCETTRQLYHRLGDTTTLQLPNRTGVTFVTWDVNNIDHIALTRPDQLVVKNSSYSGRLSVASDGSLLLSRITSNDRQVFRAEVFINNYEHYCTQLFDVQVSENSKTSAGNDRLNLVIQLSLSACVLALTLFILFHHIRTECTAKPGAPDHAGPNIKVYYNA